MFVNIRETHKSTDVKDVVSIDVPGVDSNFQILNNHDNLVSLLKKGTLKYKDITGKEYLLNIERSGIIYVANNNVKIILL